MIEVVFRKDGWLSAAGTHPADTVRSVKTNTSHEETFGNKQTKGQA